MGTFLRLTPATVAVIHEIYACGSDFWGLLIVERSGYPSGTVYPILDRLERAGYVSSCWDVDVLSKGPRRRIYSVTEEGREWMRVQLEKKGVIS